MIKVYHNPQCSKSRECMLFLEETGQPYEVIKYLENVPSADELKSIIKMLGIKPIDLVRQNEDIWIEKYKGKKLAPAQVIKAMIKYPILIQRPIVVSGDKAIIARPLEKAAEIL